MHWWIIWMQNYFLCVFVIEVEDLGFMMIYPDDGMIEFLHFNSYYSHTILRCEDSLLELLHRGAFISNLYQEPAGEFLRSIAF